VQSPMTTWDWLLVQRRLFFFAVAKRTVGAVRLGRDESMDGGSALSGIELAHRSRKRQFSFGPRGQRRLWSLKQFWDRALA
jgi:hypothetical protein